MSYIHVEIMGIDCTNQGVTSGRAYALLENGNGVIDVIGGDTPKLKLRSGRAGRKYIAVPIDTSDEIYPMFGGHFIYSDDSRFPSDTPIHVHDRFED